MDDRFWNLSSRDKNRESRDIRAKLPEDIVRSIEVAIATRQIPSQTVADFVRSAVASAAAEIPELNGSGNSLSKLWLLERSLDYDVAKHNREQALADKVLDNWYRNRTNGHSKEARKQIEAAIEAISDATILTQLQSSLQ